MKLCSGKKFLFLYSCAYVPPHTASENLYPRPQKSMAMPVQFSKLLLKHMCSHMLSDQAPTHPVGVSAKPPKRAEIRLIASLIAML